MIGGIYTDQKCTLCGSNYRNNHSSALVCSNHPDQHATRLMVRFGKLTKRFQDYKRAFKFLNGVRHETDMGNFDIRDYRRDNPMGFSTLANQWLEFKRGRVEKKTWNGLNNHLRYACRVWGNQNIKSIQYADLETFLYPRSEEDPLYHLASKTRANVRSTLHSFWIWLVKCRILGLHQLPEFPEVGFTLALRKTVDKTAQQRIIGEIYELTHAINIKVWLGIKWLSTYINLRPGELLNIKEGDIDLDQGWILIPNPKEREPKFVFLIQEDVDILRSLPRGLPHLYFFRHQGKRKGVVEGTQFGPRYLYKWWKKACSNLGIEGVDLYGGTRHSSAIDLRKRHSTEDVKRATMHQTNKAFDRYLQLTAEELRPLYADTQGENVVKTQKGGIPRGKVLNIKE